MKVLRRGVVDDEKESFASGGEPPSDLSRRPPRAEEERGDGGLANTEEGTEEPRDEPREPTVLGRGPSGGMGGIATSIGPTRRGQTFGGPAGGAGTNRSRTCRGKRARR